MKWSIEYINKGNYFKVVNEGIYETSDSIKIYREIFSHKLWRPNSSILIDNRRVDFRNVNYLTMSQASSNLANNSHQIGSGRIAYLTGSQLEYGVSRQFQILAQDKVSTKIEIFKYEDEALKWISQAGAIRSKCSAPDLIASNFG